MNKKLLKKIFPYFVIASFIFYTRGSSIINNFSLQGKIIPSSHTVQFGPLPLEDLSYPPKRNSISIFWHSQCAPCKVEMKRLRKSIESNSIDKNKIFAINPFESDEVIKKFIRKNPYPFRFIKDNGISRRLDIKVTPTTVFIKDNELKSINTGMSIVGIWLAESFI